MYVGFEKQDEIHTCGFAAQMAVEWHAKTDWHKSHIDNKEIIGADLYEIKRQSRNRHWR